MRKQDPERTIRSFLAWLSHKETKTQLMQRAPEALRRETYDIELSPDDESALVDEFIKNLEREDAAHREEYPECEKVMDHADEASGIIQFFEWLNTQGLQLAGYHRHTDECYENESDKHKFGREICGINEQILHPHYEQLELMIHQCFGIDTKELDRERGEILRKQVEAAGTTSP